MKKWLWNITIERYFGYYFLKFFLLRKPWREIFFSFSNNEMWLLWSVVGRWLECVLRYLAYFWNWADNGGKFCFLNLSWADCTILWVFKTSLIKYINSRNNQERDWGSPLAFLIRLYLSNFSGTVKILTSLKIHKNQNF